MLRRLTLARLLLQQVGCRGQQVVAFGSAPAPPPPSSSQQQQHQQQAAGTAAASTAAATGQEGSAGADGPGAASCSGASAGGVEAEAAEAGSLPTVWHRILDASRRDPAVLAQTVAALHAVAWRPARRPGGGAADAAEQHEHEEAQGGPAPLPAHPPTAALNELLRLSTLHRQIYSRDALAAILSDTGAGDGETFVLLHDAFSYFPSPLEQGGQGQGQQGRQPQGQGRQQQQHDGAFGDSASPSAEQPQGQQGQQGQQQQQQQQPQQPQGQPQQTQRQQQQQRPPAAPAASQEPAAPPPAAALLWPPPARPTPLPQRPRAPHRP